MPNFELLTLLSQTSDEKIIVNDSIQTQGKNIQKIEIMFFSFQLTKKHKIKRSFNNMYKTLLR